MFPDYIPLDQALVNILSIAPLKGDAMEEKTIIKFLIFLIENNCSLLLVHIEKIIEILIDALISLKKYKIKEILKIKIINIIK